MHEILQAALAAVDPFAAVTRSLQRSGDRLAAAGVTYDLAAVRRVLVLGAGKAGAPMAQAVEQVLGERIDDGLVVVKDGHGGATHKVRIVEAAHPVPNAAGLAAGQELMALAAATTADDLAIVLLSGGGSALLEALPASLTIESLQAATTALLRSGAPIQAINALRKHLSLLKGGQLARLLYPAQVLTLVLSDVVGSPPDVIASGPTTPDRSTWQDVAAVVAQYDLWEALPAEVAGYVRRGIGGEWGETPKPGDPLFARCQTVIVGDNRTAALAAARTAQRLGWQTLLLTTALEGEAAAAARFVAAIAREIRTFDSPVAAPACVLLGGETTVTLRGEIGEGGRNQELALAAAVALDGMPGVTLASLATDGSDGPTAAAGGLVDGATLARGRALGLDAGEALRRHDALPYLRATGDLLVTGPTRTNVNDLIVLLVEPLPV
jgi:glycerate 2-kinase